MPLSIRQRIKRWHNGTKLGVHNNFIFLAEATYTTRARLSRLGYTVEA